MATDSNSPAGHSQDELRDRSIGDLLKQLSQETATLARKEVELARAEITQNAQQAGLGAGMFGGAGVAGLLALGAFTTFLIALLATAMEVWIAALIVTVLWSVIAGVLALIGRNRVQEATPPAEQTVDSIKEDVQWAKTQRPSAAR
jgi:predicted lipid-binding transport protein (Tim44 family)